FTHYQAAQPTTVGRRLSGWGYDLYLCEVCPSVFNLQLLRGFRGATGTQASFLALFEGDHKRVIEFEGRAVQSLMPESDEHLRLGNDNAAIDARRQEMIANLERAKKQFGDRWT